MAKQYKVSACLIIKDEGRYLPEWLAWHVEQGVEHFYIYDNGSQRPISEDIPETFQDCCTVVDWPGPHNHPQMDAYSDCLARFSPETEWLAFIDTDEFIRVVDGTPLPDFLDGYPDADAVLAKWTVYNANGLLEDDGRPVRERFTQTTDLYPYEMPQCKSIVRASRVSVMGPHAPIAVRFSLYVLDENHQRRRGGTGEVPANKITVDHYFTKSYSEWRAKMARGSCDPNYVRENDWFVRLNPDLAGQIGGETDG